MTRLSPPLGSVGTPRPTARAHESCRPTPARLFTRNEAITALTLAEQLAVGYGDDDPFVTGWRDELCR
jgi:hypothetical protein